MSCILLSHLNPRIEARIFELHGHFLGSRDVLSHMTKYVRRFCARAKQDYDKDLIECHANICHQMGFVGNGEYNRIVWTYFGTDYLVVRFSNPGIVLAFNLNASYYHKQIEQHQMYNFEIFVICDLLNPNDAASFEKNMTRPTFKDFIRQFDDITVEAYQVIDHVFPPVRLKLNHEFSTKS